MTYMNSYKANRKDSPIQAEQNSASYKNGRKLSRRLGTLTYKKCEASEHSACQKPKYDPRLETILMVEQFLAAYSGRYTRFQVWQRLPRKVMYQTYQVILSYLESSGKIRTEYGGRILWISTHDRCNSSENSALCHESKQVRPA